MIDCKVASLLAVSKVGTFWWYSFLGELWHISDTVLQTRWMILTLIIYESYTLLGSSQERFILFNPRLPLLCVLFISSYSASKQTCKNLMLIEPPFITENIPQTRFPLETLSLVSGFVAITCLEKEDKQKKASSWDSIKEKLIGEILKNCP